MSRIKDSSSLFIIALVLALVAIAALFIVLPMLRPTSTIRLGDGVFDGNIAYSQAEREKGLSGMTSFVNRQALLMVFPSDSQWTIWMKDMKVPIDIVWLNSQKKVIYVVKNAPPEGGENVKYTPESDARYVIELPAGTVAAKNILVGQTATFDSNEGSAN